MFKRTLSNLLVLLVVATALHGCKGEEAVKPGEWKDANDLGAVYLNKGEVDKALVHWKRALEIAEKSKDPKQLTTSLSNLAVIYFNLGRYEEAEKLLRRSYDLTVKEFGKDSVELVQTAETLAIVMKKTGRMEEAGPYYETALRIRRKKPEDPLLATTLTNVGTYKSATGKLDEALKMFQEAEKIYEKGGVEKNLSGLVVIWNNMGSLYLRAGQPKKAEKSACKID